MRTLERSNLEWRGICTVYECRTQMIHGVDLIWLSQAAQTMILRYSTNLKNTVTPISLACLDILPIFMELLMQPASQHPHPASFAFLRCQEGRFLEPEWSLAEAGLSVTWTCPATCPARVGWRHGNEFHIFIAAISWDMTPYNNLQLCGIWMYMNVHDSLLSLDVTSI